MTAQQPLQLWQLHWKAQHFSGFPHIFFIISFIFGLHQLRYTINARSVHTEIPFFCCDFWYHLNANANVLVWCRPYFVFGALADFFFVRCATFCSLSLNAIKRRSFGDSDVQLFIDKVFLGELSNLYFTPRCSHSKCYECGISLHIAESKLNFQRKFHSQHLNANDTKTWMKKTLAQARSWTSK